MKIVSTIFLSLITLLSAQFAMSDLPIPECKIENHTAGCLSCKFDHNEPEGPVDKCTKKRCSVLGVCLVTRCYIHSNGENNCNF